MDELGDENIYRKIPGITKYTQQVRTLSSLSGLNCFECYLKIIVHYNFSKFVYLSAFIQSTQGGEDKYVGMRMWDFPSQLL